MVAPETQSKEMKTENSCAQLEQLIVAVHHVRCMLAAVVTSWMIDLVNRYGKIWLCNPHSNSKSFNRIRLAQKQKKFIALSRLQPTVL